MKSNFYEKIILIENEEKKNLIIKKNKLLDESFETLILRKRKMDEIKNTDIKSKIIDKFNEFRLSQNNDNNSNENNSDNSNNSNLNYIVSKLGELRRQWYASRLQRILN